MIITKETKDLIAMRTAGIVLIFGLILTGTGFFIEPIGEIHESVLWVLGQCLAYAGGIFGIGIYTKSRLDDIEMRIGRSADMNKTDIEDEEQ